MLEKFNQLYKPDANCVLVSNEVIEKYQDKVPALLIDLWKANGFGKYNDGLIEIINPEEYENVLWTWLGREVENYIPFAITGFGELIYYRKLTDEDEDVCMIDIQYRKIETLVWSFKSFFERFLIEEESRKDWLREDLFLSAINEKGGLKRNEVFTITPALAMGGAAELSYLQKGNAQVYQDILFQMTS